MFVIRESTFITTYILLPGNADAKVHALGDRHAKYREKFGNRWFIEPRTLYMSMILNVQLKLSN